MGCICQCAGALAWVAGVLGYGLWYSGGLWFGQVCMDIPRVAGCRSISV